VPKQGSAIPGKANLSFEGSEGQDTNRKAIEDRAVKRVVFVQ
jgi:hypothetical protein